MQPGKGARRFCGVGTAEPLEILGTAAFCRVGWVWHAGRTLDDRASDADRPAGLADKGYALSGKPAPGAIAVTLPSGRVLPTPHLFSRWSVWHTGCSFGQPGKISVAVQPTPTFRALVAADWKLPSPRPSWRNYSKSPTSLTA